MIQSATAGDTKLELLTRIIVECARPRRVILFGSRARGEGREASAHDAVEKLLKGRSHAQKPRLL